MQRVIEPELMEDRDQILAFHKARRPFSQTMLQECYDRFIGLTNGTVIDLGCGTGSYLQGLKEKYPNLSLIGVDGSQGMIELANNSASGIDFRCQRLQELVLPPCNAVTCFFTIHHLHNPKILFDLLLRKSFCTSVLIIDIVRPLDLEQAISISQLLGADQNVHYQTDLFNSLCAALDENEFDMLIAETNLTRQVVQHEKFGKLIIITGII